MYFPKEEMDLSTPVKQFFIIIKILLIYFLYFILIGKSNLYNSSFGKGYRRKNLINI